MFAMLEPVDWYYYRTVKVGQTVKFPCHTRLPEDVDWARFDLLNGSETFIYLGTHGPRDLGRDPRFKVLQKNQWHSLVIYNVTVDDSAYYRCAEDINRHFYRLNVQGNFMFYFRLCFRLHVFFFCQQDNKEN